MRHMRHYASTTLATIATFEALNIRGGSVPWVLLLPQLIILKSALVFYYSPLWSLLTEITIESPKLSANKDFR